MLNSTFQHLKGIGKKKEYQLWESGVTSWQDFENQQEVQLSIFGQEKDTDSILTESKQSLQKGNVAFSTLPFCV